MRDLTTASFRANPAYELVVLDRLTTAERARAGDSVPGDLYGVLRPLRGSPLEWRTVSRETALLLFTLRDPAPIPEYVRRDLGHDAVHTVARLVLDGVLEIAHDGAFLSGAAAHALVTGPSATRERGRNARLSLDALQYAEVLDDLPIADLALRLYLYGRRPLTPDWQRRLSTETAVQDFLGLLETGPLHKMLRTSWFETPSGERPYWRMWRPRRIDPGAHERGYKLYVSPDCEGVPAALLALSETLADAPGVRGFKVGRDLAGLCRPDKIVAYFSRFEDLQAAAARLQGVLAGSRPHGVPFTAGVTVDGLLSWGIDPPAVGVSGARPRRSWRLWLVDRLAEYLCAARTSALNGVAPWQFALDRLRMDGVDPDTWVPASRIWDLSSTIA